MEEVEKIWMDGKFVDWKDAKIHVLTHTFHYGGGVFEGIRYYKTADGPAVFRLKDHINRLFHSAQAFHMDLKDITREDIIQATLDTIEVNKIKEGYIRPIIYYGYGKMGLVPVGAKINVSIAVWPWGPYLGEDPVKVKISSFMRIHPKTTDPNAKICGNYANSILASNEAKIAGFDEAVLLDYKGNIAEGPGENIFMVKDDTLITVPLGTILPGITRESIITIAKDEGIEVEEKDIKPKELKKADEVFFTGTAAEVHPIKQVDDTPIGTGSIGPITAKLKSIYYDVVHGKVEKYKKWLDYVEK